MNWAGNNGDMSTSNPLPDTSTKADQLVGLFLGAMRQYQSACKGENIRETCAKNKEEGRVVPGPPPYGFFVAKRRSKKVYVRDVRQRAIGKKIVEWRHEMGFTFEQIYFHLERLGYRHGRKSKGAPWPTTLSQWCLAELILQAEEKAQVKKPCQKGNVPPVQEGASPNHSRSVGGTR